MQHDPFATAPAPVDPRPARHGLRLFLVYLFLYGGFVGIAAFAPERMERIVFAGLNLAIVYGMFLIVLAFALALLYGWLCRPLPTRGGEAK
ncbi:MAG TPA: DUF485 domain-containing protein [Planctomycetia bacterium]|nr:DUF485 domain-containing protein [Planctomycetia bacterium]